MITTTPLLWSQKNSYNGLKMTNLQNNNIWIFFSKGANFHKTEFILAFVSYDTIWSFHTNELNIVFVLIDDSNHGKTKIPWTKFLKIQVFYCRATLIFLKFN